MHDLYFVYSHSFHWILKGKQMNLTECSQSILGLHSVHVYLFICMCLCVSFQPPSHMTWFPVTCWLTFQFCFQSLAWGESQFHCFIIWLNLSQSMFLIHTSTIISSDLGAWPPDRPIRGSRSKFYPLFKLSRWLTLFFSTGNWKIGLSAISLS